MLSPGVRLSVCASVTFVSCAKTNKDIDREPRGVSLAEKRTNFPLYDIVSCIR